MLLTALLGACGGQTSSSPADGASDGGTAGTSRGGAGVAGAPRTTPPPPPPGGAGRMGFGGTPGGDAGAPDIGGRAGAPSVSGGATTGGAPGNVELECRGIRSNMACPIPGKRCDDLRCGLADTGRRTCECAAAVWTCTACDFSNSPYRAAPAGVAPCDLEIADGIACDEASPVCFPTMVGEACACYGQGSQFEWDCDDPPWQ